MAKKYSEEVKQFIYDHVEGRRTKELVELVNEKFGLDFTYSKMRSFMKNHGLRNNLPTSQPSGLPTKLFPQEIMDYINCNYKGTGPNEMTEQLNKRFGTNYTVKQIKAYYGRRKLNSGITGWFEKGFVPHNKGKKGVGGWPPTQFKKGNIPPNYKPVGSQRISRDGYVQVKVADPNKWKPLHTIIWEKHHGKPVPRGHAVLFGDGNKRNFDPENLILVSRQQLALLNKQGLIQNHADLTRVALKVVDVQLKIGERQKNS
jgi:hypothetical protein